MEQKEKFYKKQWFIWILLIFFPPVGIIFMWITKKDFRLLKKILLTIFALLWWIICIGFSNSNNSSTNNMSTEDTAIEESTTESKLEKTNTSEPTENDSEEVSEESTEYHI